MTNERLKAKVFTFFLHYVRYTAVFGCVGGGPLVTGGRVDSRRRRSSCAGQGRRQSRGDDGRDVTC